MIDGEFAGCTVWFYDPNKIVLGEKERADLDDIREAIEHELSNYSMDI